MAQNHDIEDVLTSIRRLVSTDPADVPKMAAASASNSAPALVLDDSHRVTDPEDPFQMIRSLAQAERDGRDATYLTDALSEELRDIVDDLSPAPHPVEDWDTPETSNEADAPVPPLSLVEDYREDGDFEAEGAAEDTAPEDTVAEAEDAPEGAAEVDEDAPAAEAQNTAPEAAQSDLTDLSAGLGQDGNDEALRDLITEIVRQELSGELGERITRNVRKLVRREIRQVLAAEDLD